jgi:rubrerythrin
MPSIPKVEKTLLDEAITDEVEADEMYQKLIDACDDDGEKSTYEAIQKQERHHKKLLENIKRHDHE